MNLRLHEHSPIKNNGNYCLEDFTSGSSGWDGISTPVVILSPELKFVHIIES